MKTVQTIVVVAILAVLIIIAIVVVRVAPLVIEEWRYLSALPRQPFPSSVSQAFDSWDGAWILPPLATAEYDVKVRYERKQGGRLGDDEPLRIKLTDETVGKTVPLEGDPIFYEPETIVGTCHLLEGHKYRVEVDADQADKLGRHHHRLEISLTFDELLRRRWPSYDGDGARQKSRRQLRRGRQQGEQRERIGEER